MKVLFVHSGNSDLFPVSPFLRSQAQALEEQGVEVVYFSVKGRGPSYLRNLPLLRRMIREEAPDIVHAHYSLCGLLAVLSMSGKPLVVSLMGSDALGEYGANGKRVWGSWFYVGLTYLIQPFMDAIIYKSQEIGKAVWRKGIGHCVPNGVRLDQFERMDQATLRTELGLDPRRKHVLFLGSSTDLNKNIALAERAIAHLDRPDVEFHAIHGIPHDLVVKYLNVADVFLLCSHSEGSPNVIKEAMSCDCPIVSTAVGDAEWVIGDTAGCFIASHDPEDFASKIEKALAHGGRTHGRERIKQIGLDGESVAHKLIHIYRSISRG